MLVFEKEWYSVKQNNVVNLMQRYPNRFQNSIYENNNLKLNSKDTDMIILNKAIAETASDLFALICTKLNIF